MKPFFEKYWSTILSTSRTVLFHIVGLVVLSGLMLYRLGSLNPDISQAELDTLNSASSLAAIGNDMVNAPYKLAVFFSTQLFDSTFGLRLVNAGLGILAVVIFYLLVRRLYGSLITVSTTAMFATSSLLLATSRQATPHIMLLSVLLLIGVGFYLRFGKRSDIGWLLTVFVVGLTLYAPGMAPFVIAAAAWQFRRTRISFEQLKTPIIIGASVMLGVLCAPLIISIIRDPGIWRGYLGLPETFVPPVEMLKYSASAIASLFFRSPLQPDFWLGRQPILDIFAVVMFVYGSYTLIRQYKLDRLWTLGGIFLIAIIWIGLTTNRLGIILLLPFVYIIVGIGLQNLINQWLVVFPRNPIARTVGSILLAIAICLSINFQTYRYFVAWPNNDDTRSAFSLPYPS